MAPNSKPVTGQTFKQGTLSFGSSKHGAQATASGKTKTSIVAAPSKPQVAVNKARNQRSSSTASTISLGSTTSSSQDDDDFLMLSNDSTASVQRAVKRLKTTTGSAKAVNKVKKPINVDESSDEEEEEPQTPRTSLDDVLKSKSVNKLYSETKQRMGGVPLIHAEKQTKVHNILRVFDLSYEYGPCVGMTRLQRWQRADAMGLKPPADVLEILKTEEAKKEDQLRQSVFYDTL